MSCVNGHRCCSACCEALRRRATADQSTFVDVVYRLVFGVAVDCPLCRVRGPFRADPDVDAAVSAHPARCPYVHRTSGDQCCWVGPYGRLTTHAHRVPVIVRSRSAVELADVDP